MIDKTKDLGLAFVAVAAFSALAASAAQAGSFDVSAQPAVITGANLAGQEQAFTLPVKGGGSIITKCAVATFEGTTQGQTNITETTVTPTYSGCKVAGLSATIRMNGCKYTITGAGQPAGTAVEDITGCTAGKKAELVVPAMGCVITVGEQSNLAHLAFDPTGADLLTTFTLTGITFTEGANCLEPGHTGTNGSITGDTTTRAFVDAGTVQVTKHSHQYAEHICAAQVSLTAT